MQDDNGKNINFHFLLMSYTAGFSESEDMLPVKRGINVSLPCHNYVIQIDEFYCHAKKKDDH